LKENPSLPKHIVELFITYHNGHNPTDFFDKKNPAAAFAWRILHRFFLENRQQTTLNAFFHTIENQFEWESFQIPQALSLVAKAYREAHSLSKDERILIYLGLDEFNRMGSTCNCPRFSPHLHLRHLVEELGNVYVEPPTGTTLVFCMAGVYLQPLQAITNESGFPLKHIPISLIQEKTFLSSLCKTFSWDEKTITINHEWFDFPSFRKALTFWTGIPGYSVKFLKELFDKMLASKKSIAESSEIIEQIQRELIEHVAGRLAELPYQGLLDLVARSIIQEPAILSQEWLSHNEKYGTWDKAQKSGLCLIHNGLVKIPLCYLMVFFHFHLNLWFFEFFFFAYFSTPKLTKQLAPSSSGKVDPLQASINTFITEVDERLMKDPDWVLWENFGACYHAMKINSFLRLGFKKIHLHQLHKGAVIHEEINDLQVCLKEVSLVRSSVPMNPKLPANLMRFKEYGNSFDWSSGSFVVWNEHDGEGIDSWSCYHLPDGKLVIDGDQRKAVSGKLGTKPLADLVGNALAVLPTEIENKDIFRIVGVFSGKAEQAKKLAFPKNAYVVTKEVSAKYHGIFSSYPPANPYISINDPGLTQSTLVSTMRGQNSATFPALTKEILDERKSGRFTSEEDLRARVKGLDKIEFSEFILFE